MARPKSSQPTDRELSILGILWDESPLTVRQIHEKLSVNSDTGYTTTLKIMQIMVDKSLLLRDQSGKTHLYMPAITRDITQKNLVSDLLKKAFSGSAGSLVLQALKNNTVDDNELAQIKKILDDMEGVDSDECNQ